MRFLSLNFWCRTNASNKTFQSMQPLVDKLHSPKRPQISGQRLDLCRFEIGSLSSLVPSLTSCVVLTMLWPHPPLDSGAGDKCASPRLDPSTSSDMTLLLTTQHYQDPGPLLHSTVNYDFVAATVYTGKCTNIPPDILISLIFTKILGHLTLTSAAPER